jgi:hypothetical protein
MNRFFSHQQHKPSSVSLIQKGIDDPLSPPIVTKQLGKTYTEEFHWRADVATSVIQELIWKWIHFHDEILVDSIFLENITENVYDSIAKMIRRNKKGTIGIRVTVHTYHDKRIARVQYQIIQSIFIRVLNF